MDQFFAGDWKGPAFEFLGTAHLVALGCIVLLNVLLLRFKHASDSTKSGIRWAMALTLWANEFGWHWWNYSVGRWDIQTMLPFHICSILVWLGGWMLVTKNYALYEYMYLIGIGGAIQAIMTPDVGIYGYPHYRFFQTFISHGLIVTAAIYMTAVEGMRPTWKSLLRVAIGLNIYMIPVFFLNQAIGSNYLFINHKPETASLLDALPEWPVYILYMEVLGLVTFLILYLPFAIKDLWNRYHMNRDNASRLESISK